MKMPDKEWIDKAKETHGRLYKVAVGDSVYLFRPIKRGEHLSIQKEVFPDAAPQDQSAITAEQNAALENKIIAKCVVWPENLKVDELDAGVPQTLILDIMRYSGFAMSAEPEEV